MKASYTLTAAVILALAAPVAYADSQVSAGAAGSPTATVTATAATDLQLLVPVIVALRVGDTSQKTLSTFTTSLFSGPLWDGTINDVGANSLLLTYGATVSPAGSGSGAAASGYLSQISAWAWTNNVGGAALKCSYATVGTDAPGSTGPAASDFEVSSGVNGALPMLLHPGNTSAGTPSTLQVACPTASTTVPKVSLQSAIWSFGTSTSANLSTFTAGNYQRRITYTLTAN